MFKQIFYFCLLLVFVQTAKLPKNWKTCKKNDPKNLECLKGAIQEAIRELARQGNQPFGVLPLDPLRFKEITIDQGQGPVSIKLDYRDLDLIGFKDIIITDVKNNDWKEIKLQMEVPKLILKGKYKINGKVLVLPINGDGDCELIFSKYTALATLKLKENTKGGKTYYEVLDFPFVMNAANVHFQFKNLFNGDKALGDNMNVFLNENSKEILGELGPAISRAFGNGFKNIANRIFSKVPVADISH